MEKHTVIALKRQWNSEKEGAGELCRGLIKLLFLPSSLSKLGEKEKSENRKQKLKNTLLISPSYKNKVVKILVGINDAIPS